MFKQSHTVARRLIAVATLGLALTAMSLPSAGALNRVALNTGQEVLSVRTGASGSFTYTIDGNELCFVLVARNLSTSAFAAHIHEGPRHVAEPPLVDLFTTPMGTDFVVDDCVTFDAAVLADIEANPQDYYVNVHTTTHPAGEIRGQLH